eukprot:scaffold78118_cov30-Tisochrysis_lutea.AAC.2
MQSLAMASIALSRILGNLTKRRNPSTASMESDNQSEQNRRGAARSVVQRSHGGSFPNASGAGSSLHPFGAASASRPVS